MDLIEEEIRSFSFIPFRESLTVFPVVIFLKDINSGRRSLRQMGRMSCFWDRVSRLALAEVQKDARYSLAAIARSMRRLHYRVGENQRVSVFGFGLG
jgi:hypothetical protein